MAYKKIDQVFILSDSTVNVYGFRLLTSGFLMDEFLKNPIGYYNHDKTDGVLCKWEDVQLDGDRVTGKPVINMEHPRAERTIKEIEDGFLNAASVGHICLLDHEVEPNPDDAEHPILCGTKWYNKECSLVDSPGNRNAFKAGLYDVHEQEINLSDKSFFKKQLPSMKEVKLPVSAALISMLSLSDEPTADAVVKGIKDLYDTNERLGTELAAEQEKATSKEVADLLQQGLADKKLTPALKTRLELQYAGKPKELKELMDVMPAHAGVVETINSHRAKAAKDVADLKDLSWDELDKSGKLQDLKDNDPDAYADKFAKRFKKTGK